MERQGDPWRHAAVIESEIRRLFIAAATKQFPQRVRLYTRNVGVFRLNGDRYFRAGIKGQADVTGYYRTEGGPRPIEVELKMPRGTMTPEQEAWRTHCEEWGVTYLLLTVQKDEADPIPRFVGQLGAAIS